MQAATLPSDLLYCSFCRKDRAHVAMLVSGGPGVSICDACVSLCNRVLTGKPTAPSAGWPSLTNEELLATLPAAAAAIEAVEEQLHEHVSVLRQREVTWERIAASLGVTRQAAWERFSRELRR